MQNRHIILGAILVELTFVDDAQAVSPAPDGCYPNFTTAEGCNALRSLTNGAGNTGIGWNSLSSNATANFNTGVGAVTLALSNGQRVRQQRLWYNAHGRNALVNNTGSENNAFGDLALEMSKPATRVVVNEP